MKFENMSSSNLQKMEVDYSTLVDESLPEVKQLADAGQLDEALEKLMSLEKQTRGAADAISTGRILQCIVEVCVKASDWSKLNEYLLVMSKKRGQLKQATTKMVQSASQAVDKTPDKERKIALIDTLRTVTAGKIYVEVERARLTKQLAEIREAEGNIAEAATVLQELQVETFGSMPKVEKVEFILEQMRLCLAKKDTIRTQIISKKISTKFFSEENTDELKLKYYRLMIQLDSHEDAYLETSKHYRHIFDTPSVLKNEEEALEALKCVVIYLILAPFDNEQHDLMHRQKGLRELEKIPVYRSLLSALTTQEIISWRDFCSEFEKALKDDTTKIFSDPSKGTKRWDHLHDRIIEHNIRVMAAYYTRIRLSRMAELLDLSETKVEEYLSQLVVSGTVRAKIDRLEGTVNFVQPKNATDILNDWSSNLNDLMTLINKTTHLINKEKMVHQI